MEHRVWLWPSRFALVLMIGKGGSHIIRAEHTPALSKHRFCPDRGPCPARLGNMPLPHSPKAPLSSLACSGLGQGAQPTGATPSRPVLGIDRMNSGRGGSNDFFGCSTDRLGRRFLRLVGAGEPQAAVAHLTPLEPPGGQLQVGHWRYGNSMGFWNTSTCCCGK